MKATCHSLGGARNCQAIPYRSHLRFEIGTGIFWSPAYFLVSGAVQELSSLSGDAGFPAPWHMAPRGWEQWHCWILVLHSHLVPRSEPQPLARTCPAVLMPCASPLRSTGCPALILYTWVTQPRSVKCLCSLPGFPCSRLCPQTQARFVPGSLPHKQLPPAWRGGGSAQPSPLLHPAGGGWEGSVSQLRSPGRAAPSVCSKQRVEGTDPCLQSQLAHLPLTGGEGPGGERSYCVCFARRQR